MYIYIHIYCCLTAALLLLYCCFTTGKGDSYKEALHVFSVFAFNPKKVQLYLHRTPLPKPLSFSLSLSLS